jgi:hypothetical protein
VFNSLEVTQASCWISAWQDVFFLSHNHLYHRDARQLLDIRLAGAA